MGGDSEINFSSLEMHMTPLWAKLKLSQIVAQLITTHTSALLYQFSFPDFPKDEGSARVEEDHISSPQRGEKSPTRAIGSGVGENG